MHTCARLPLLRFLLLLSLIASQQSYSCTVAQPNAATNSTFIGVDAQLGNDTSCAVVAFNNLAQVSSFVPCRTVQRAVSIVSMPHTWIQLLPATYSVGNLTVSVSDVTIAASTPTDMSSTVLAAIGGGSWMQRMLATDALPSPQIDCTGHDNCFISASNFSVIGLTFTGALEHAIVQWNNSNTLLADCTFRFIGGMLRKLAGGGSTATIIGCSMTTALPTTTILALLQLEESSLQMTDSTFEDNQLFEPSSIFNSSTATPTSRTCVSITSMGALQWVNIDRCTWRSNSASSWPSDAIVPLATPRMYGGMCLRVLAASIDLQVTNSSFLESFIDGSSVLDGGAVSVVAFAAPSSMSDHLIATFQGCTFQNINATNHRGGALAIALDSNLVASHNQYDVDFVNDLSGMLNALEVTILGCNFQGVSANVGGALFIAPVRSLNLTDTVFSYCSAGLNGGAIAIVNPVVVDASNTDNVLFPIQLFPQRTYTLNRVLMQWTSATSYAGAVFVRYLMGVDFLLTNCTFLDSTLVGPSTWGGGGFQCMGMKYLKITNCIFENLVTNDGGGAMDLSSITELYLESNTFRNCSSTISGGAIRLDRSQASIITSTFSECRLDPAPHWDYFSSLTRLGGAIHALSSTLTIQQSNFSDCHALPYDLSFDQTCGITFNSNTGMANVGLGGAIAVEQSTLVCQGCTGERIRACTGGFVFARTSDLHVESSQMLDVAAWSGGTAVADSCDAVSVKSTTVTQSTALRLGGVLACRNCGFFEFDNNFFRFTSAPYAGVLWMKGGTSAWWWILDNSFLDPFADVAGAAYFLDLEGWSGVLPSFQGNALALVQRLPPIALYGQMYASSLAKLQLAAAASPLIIYPGQTIVAGELLVFALDVYNQTMTADSSSVVLVESVMTDGTSNPRLTFHGRTLQQVQAETGAADFSGLQLLATPANYTLRFSLLTQPSIAVILPLLVIADCPPSTFYDSSQRSCRPCESDVLVYSAKVNKCAPCRANEQRMVSSNASIGPLQDGVICSPCPLGQVSAAGGTCAICSSGTYQSAVQSDCTPCTDQVGLNCDAGGLAAVHEGYFAFAVADATATGGARIEIFTCPETFCSAAPVQSTTSASSSAVNSYGQCAFPRLASPDNLLCGECADSFQPWGTKCARCDTVHGGYLLLLLLLSFVLVFWLVLSAVTASSVGHSVIGLYFVQTCMLELGSVNSLLTWLNVVLFSPDSVGDCIAPLTTYQQVQIQILMPLFLMAEFIVVAAVHGLAWRCWHAVSKEERAPSHSAPLPVRLRYQLLWFISTFSIDVYISATFSLLLFCYTQVTVACLRYLNCVNVGGVNVVFSQPAMRCDSVEYRRTYVLVIIAVIGYVAGFPIGMAVFLKRNVTRVKEAYGIVERQMREAAIPCRLKPAAPPLQMAPLSDAARFHVRVAPLFAMYSPLVWWWQVVVLLRRLLFVAISVALVRSPRDKFLAYTLAHVASQLLQIYFQPFRIAFLNTAEFASHVMLIVLSATLISRPPPMDNSTQVWLFLVVLLPLLLFPLFAVWDQRRTEQQLHHHRSRLSLATRASVVAEHRVGGWQRSTSELVPSKEHTDAIDTDTRTVTPAAGDSIESPTVSHVAPTRISTAASIAPTPARSRSSRAPPLADASFASDSASADSIHFQLVSIPSPSPADVIVAEPAPAPLARSSRPPRWRVHYHGVAAKAATGPASQNQGTNAARSVAL